MAVSSVDGDLSLYVGGAFTAVGGKSTSNLSRFDGRNWHAVGEGFAGPVLTMLAFGSGDDQSLFVGGWFYEVAGMTARGIARWDGEAWHSLNTQQDPSSVRALAAFDDGTGAAVYAGGTFLSMNDKPLNRIARWDGTTWLPLGSGLDGTVNALATFDDGAGDALYVGGTFTEAGGRAAAGIARWDGLHWSALGEGIEGTVHTLAVHNDGSGPALFVAGEFGIAGDSPASNIAKWDGQSWEPVGSGINGEILSLLSVTNDEETALYAAGEFTMAGGAPAFSVARWDGSNWSAVGDGLRLPSFGSNEGKVFSLAQFDSGAGVEIHACGNFGRSGTVPLKNLARWNGSAWTPPGNGVNVGSSGNLWDIAVDCDETGETVYVGGFFFSAGDKPLQAVAMWDGDEWFSLGEVNDGAAMTLLLDDLAAHTMLYVGGVFGSIDGTPTMNIAAWDGTTWKPLGDGLTSTNDIAIVRNLAFFDDGTGRALYAAGSFSMSGTTAVSNIAKWDGNEWLPVGDGLNGDVRALAVFDDGSGPALYAGGEFTAADNQPGDYLARWDGTSWSAIPQGMTGPVFALKAHGDQLLVGASGIDDAMNRNVYAAAWDGQHWIGFAGDALFVPRVFEVFDDGSGPQIYAGALSVPDTDSVFWKWNGSAWVEPFGGIGAPVPQPIGVIALATSPCSHTLFIGGAFSVAGTQSSGNIASLHRCASPPPPADLNGDGVINVLDLLILLGHWGVCDNPDACPGDLNDDGAVAVFDLLILLSAWGSEQSPR